MAWPYDMEGYSTPQLSTIGGGNFGSSIPFTTDNASGAQNLASMFASTGAGAGTPAATGGGGIFQSMGDYWKGDGLFSRTSLLGGTDERGVTTKGWAPMALGIGQAIYGGMQANKTMKLAQDQFKEGKRQFDLNYGAQRSSMNTAMEDRQRARVASNPGAYESVSSYMDKNRIQ